MPDAKGYKGRPEMECRCLAIKACLPYKPGIHGDSLIPPGTKDRQPCVSPMIYHFYQGRVEEFDFVNEYSYPGQLMKDDPAYWNEMEEEE